MNHFRRPDSSLQTATPTSGPVATQARADTGFVRHAVLDVRAGLPLLVRSRQASFPPAIVLAAETATESGLARFRRGSVGAAQLVRQAVRAAAELPPSVSDGQQTGGLVAFDLPPRLLAPAAILALADPTGTDGRPIAPHPAAHAALALAKLGRLMPAMVLSQAGEAGDMIVVAAEDILAYRTDALHSLARVAEAVVPLAEAEDARLVAYRPADGGTEHLALLIGRPETMQAPPLVRIHSECFTGDRLGSLRCDCGPQLHEAIRRMEAEGGGVLLYMAQEGRGIGLVNKLRAYALQDQGLDTLDANRALGWDADERDFAAAAMMLHDLGITRIRLLTNNPAKVAALQTGGIEVTDRLRHVIAANGVNDSYLETKARRFGHLLG